MKHILALLITVCLPALLWAQVRLTATTDKTDLALDDELTLTVQVTGASGTMVMPQLPSLPAFNVYSREAAQSTVNGKSTFQFRYTMMPRFVGNTTIGPITFKYGGQIYQTKPINIRIYRNTPPAAQTQPVTQGQTVSSAKAARDVANLPPLERELSTRAYAHAQEPYFMVAAVSNKTPYVNEPFILAVRFYYSQAFYDAPYQNPSVSNLFMEESGNAQGQQTIQNTLYRYEEKRYRLWGASAGEANISGATVSFRPGSSPLSVFDRFFGGAAVQPEQTVSSKPIKLMVKAVPAAGKPASFYGAVGTGYTFTAKLDRNQTEAGDAVTWSSTVQGPGNLKSTADLVFPGVDGIAAYPAAPQAGYLPNNQNRSYKVFKAELVPSSSGTYTLPALAWSYFDPQSDAYKTLYSQPLTLEVTPSTRAEKHMDFSATPTNGNGVQTLGSDIRYVRTEPTPTPSWLMQMSTWKWMHVLAFMWLAVCVFIASIGKKTAAKKHAYLHAKAQLKKAQTYENIADTLADYLLAKFKLSTASLPLKEITSALTKKRVSTPTVEQFSKLWQDLEAARFAPQAAADIAALSQRAGTLLKALEETK